MQILFKWQTKSCLSTYTSQFKNHQNVNENLSFKNDFVYRVRRRLYLTKTINTIIQGRRAVLPLLAIRASRTNPWWRRRRIHTELMDCSVSTCSASHQQRFRIAISTLIANMVLRACIHIESCGWFFVDHKRTASLRTCSLHSTYRMRRLELSWLSVEM